MEAVIVATARTPIGRANKGSLVDLRPDDLGAAIVQALAAVPGRVLDAVPVAHGLTVQIGDEGQATAGAGRARQPIARSDEVEQLYVHGDRGEYKPFIKTNWDTLTKSLGVFQGIPRIAGSVGAFCSREGKADVEQFFKDHPVSAAERTLRQAFERIDNCVAVKERQSAPASAWLASASR